MNRHDWDKVLEDLHPASFRWALLCCRGDREEAKDVLQTAYLEVLDGRARFDGRATPRTWLFAVIRRTAAGRRRTRMLRGILLGRWAQGEAIGTAPGAGARTADPRTALETAERVTRLRAALATLSGRQRQVLELVFYHDFTIEQAAVVLGIGVGSARTHYERGKKTLLERLREEGL